MEENKEYQYWLRCIEGVRNKNKKKLVEYCGSAKEVYGLNRRQLLAVKGIREEEADAVIKSRQFWNLEEKVQKLEEQGISMTTIEEKSFPRQLLELSDCPYALFYKGSLPAEEEKLVAIVGARQCSSYGRAVALKIGEQIASCGVGVVSGMAAGVDSFGHWGAIHGKGKTYAILGCGVDICYPRGAGELYERIPKNGGIISEYLPGTQPIAGQFPARNRLISAFSEAVVIVEAKRKSGSLITADCALEQGKEIYAVPGRLDDTLSCGCNELIAQGAGIVTSFDDLLLELGYSSVEREAEMEKRKNLLEKEELLVYSCFDLHTKNMEELVQMTNIPASKLADLLIRLQSKGFIEEYFKNHYRKK